MIHRYRRPASLLAALGVVAAVLAAPSAALAAPAPESTLTVHFVDAVTLLAIDRASVQVTAHQDGAVIGEFSGETDAAGVAVLIDLPHETGEGGVVTLDVVAHKSTSFTDQETGCVADDTWDASRLGVPVSDVAVAVEFTADEQQTVSSIECPPQVPVPTGEVGAAQGTPGAAAHTLPPTDALAESSPRVADPGGLVAAVVTAGAIGLLFLTPRRRRSRG